MASHIHQPRPKSQRYLLLLAIITKKKPETRARKAGELAARLMAEAAVHG